MTDSNIHSANFAPIIGVVTAGRNLGLTRERATFEWLRMYSYNHQADIAIRRARSTGSASFTDLSGNVWSLTAV